MQAAPQAFTLFHRLTANFTPGAQDVVSSVARSRLWYTLAWDDVRLRYKRSFLGPLWIILGTSFFIGVMGYLWTSILNRDAHVFLPWYAIGLIVWRYITSNLSESANTFVKAAATIQTIPMPLTIHVFRMITKNFLIFLNNSIVIVFVMIVFLIPVTPVTLLFFPGFLILLVTSAATSVLFGLIGARYRDFSHAVNAAMTPLFFLTPVLWMPDMVTGHRAALVLLNPFGHFLAVVREPLLGRIPTIMNYQVTLGLLVMISVMALGLLSRKKKSVPYWL